MALNQRPEDDPPPMGQGYAGTIHDGFYRYYKTDDSQPRNLPFTDQVSLALACFILLLSLVALIALIYRWAMRHVSASMKVTKKDNQDVHSALCCWAVNRVLPSKQRHTDFGSLVISSKLVGLMAYLLTGDSNPDKQVVVEAISCALHRDLYVMDLELVSIDDVESILGDIHPESSVLVKLGMSGTDYDVLREKLDSSKLHGCLIFVSTNSTGNHLLSLAHYSQEIRRKTSHKPIFNPGSRKISASSSSPGGRSLFGKVRV
ncbi:hypothetical protein FRC04_005972 [Tulasnella sp. 424]|nr:hypothetical protein FRC04_005972 [Tulasnella sp. 424]KAG8961445.1 hypothetical protein FRC05_005940 [Tulasnella sp. 425]